MPKGVYDHSESHSGARNGRWAGGKTSHELYDIYMDMLGRCNRSTHRRYSDYGGRGIVVCQRWMDDFWNFVEDMGPRPEGRASSGKAYWQLDRIDNDGDYGPANTRWASIYTQAKNKRGFGNGDMRRDPKTGRYTSNAN